MHIYEKHILKKLTLGDKLRYRDLKLPNVESNLFVYHLKHLIRRGLVKKEESRYSLTISGNRFVDKLSLENLNQRSQPKIATLIVLKNSKGEYLVQERKRQPFYNMLSFPYGKIHYGEEFTESARRELKEKTGIYMNLNYRGNICLRVFVGDEIKTHTLFYVFSGVLSDDREIEELNIGKFFWVKTTEINKRWTTPGFFEIFKLVSGRKKCFFEEFTFYEKK